MSVLWLQDFDLIILSQLEADRGELRTLNVALSRAKEFGDVVVEWKSKSNRLAEVHHERSAQLEQDNPFETGSVHAGAHDLQLRMSCRSSELGVQVPSPSFRSHETNIRPESHSIY